MSRGHGSFCPGEGSVVGRSCCRFPATREHVIDNENHRLPFYSSFRLLLLCYLVFPQTQGARLIYQTHVHPFLAHHEHDIDNLIISTHDRARSAGLTYLKRLIEFVKENLLGIQPKARPETPPSHGGNYAQSLLSRFNLPSARDGLAAPAGDFYGLLSAALGSSGAMSGGGGSSSKELQADDLTRSGTLIPPGMTSASEKMTFLSTQRERLKVLLSALDREADTLDPEVSIERDIDRRLAGEHLGEALRKSKSEAEFEEIGEDELKGGDRAKPTQASGWMPWAWGAAKRESGDIMNDRTVSGGGT